MKQHEANASADRDAEAGAPDAAERGERAAAGAARAR